MLATKRMERIVRIMLHCSRNVERLAAIPLTRELCAAMETPNPTTMLRNVVQTAFGDAPLDRKLHQLVLDCDLDGRFTQEGAAHANHVSRRQFYRLRSQAVSAIATRMTAILDSSDSLGGGHLFGILAESVSAVDPAVGGTIYELLGPDRTTSARLMELRARADAGERLSRAHVAPIAQEDRATALALLAQSHVFDGEYAGDVPALVAEARFTLEQGRGNFDELARFELEYLVFLTAYLRNDVRAMRASASKLGFLSASRRGLRSRALAVATEAALRAGDGVEARKRLEELRWEALHARDARKLAVANLLDAQMCYLAGKYREAEEGALASALALEHHRLDGVNAQMLLGRIRTMNGGKWDPAAVLSGRSPTSWDHMVLTLVHARALLARGDAAAALMRAEQARSIACAFALDGARAYASITLAAIYDALERRHEAQKWYATGLLEFAPVFDCVAAADLFRFPRLPQRAFGPFERIEPVIDALLARLQAFSSDGADVKVNGWRDVFQSILLMRDGRALPSEHQRAMVCTVVEVGASVILPDERQGEFLTYVHQRCER